MSKVLKVTFSVEVELITESRNEGMEWGIPDDVMDEIKNYGFDLAAAGEVSMVAYQAHDGTDWYFRAADNGLVTTAVHLVPDKKERDREVISKGSHGDDGLI